MVLKLLPNLLVLFIFIYCFYKLEEFGKSFTFPTNAEHSKSELKENEQLENVFESSNSASEKIQEFANGNEDITELKSFYDKVDILCQSKIKNCGDLVMSVDNYIQRYINLFLIISNLQEYKVRDENEEITFDLEISISGQDLTYLQSYSKNSKSSPHLKNLSKLDRIFSKIARAKERSYMENAVWFSKSFLSYLNIYSLITKPSFQSVLIFLTICSVIWTFLLFFYHHIYFCLAILINSAFIWEGLNKYWRKLKEADVEIYVRTLQKRPKDCDPDKMGWYDSFVSLFSENQCLQYYKNLSKNPSDDVSLFKCIFDIYSFYLIEMPIKIFGTSIQTFTGEISALWPWPVRVLVNIPLVVIFVVLAGIFVLILFGKRFRMSFLCAAFEFGNAEPKPDKEKTAALTANETPKSIRIIRKLKPWTKSRFPKRLNENDLRQRKLRLKYSTSKTEVEDGEELQSGRLDGEISTAVATKED